MKPINIKMPYKKRSLSILLIFIFITFMVVIATQCIEEYNPGLNENTYLLAIDGSIVRGREEQTVIITRSTQIDNTIYKPVKNCKVSVINDQNNVFQFEEKSDGKYIAVIDISYLDIGAKFRLNIITPDNNVYESGFEEIQECPPIDSLYFLEETNYSKTENQDINGLRLYVELKSRDAYTGYYRWRINETWEYRSNNIIDSEISTFDTVDQVVREYKLNEDSILVLVNEYTVTLPVPVYKDFRVKDSLHYCWYNGVVNGLYSANTLNLTRNGKKNIPLHYVFGNDERLYIRYSCLVSQYSLNEGAYNFWHNKKVEIQESGGMYFSQPSQSISNIKNINNDQETVLGYFWVSSLKQKRIFFNGPLSPWGYIPSCYLKTFNFSDYIMPDRLDTTKYLIKDPDEFPIYIVYIIDPDDPYVLIPNTAEKYCFDCREQGGTIKKPDFW